MDHPPDPRGRHPRLGPLLLANGVTVKRGHHATWWLHRQYWAEDAKAAGANPGALTRPEGTFVPEPDPGVPVKFGTTVTLTLSSDAPECYGIRDGADRCHGHFVVFRATRADGTPGPMQVHYFGRTSLPAGVDPAPVTTRLDGTGLTIQPACLPTAAKAPLAPVAGARAQREASDRKAAAAR